MCFHSSRGLDDGEVDVGEDELLDAGVSRKKSSTCYLEKAIDKIGGINPNIQEYAKYEWVDLNSKITQYYANLYLQNPDFKWAGLASLASNLVGAAETIAEYWSVDEDEKLVNLLGKGNYLIFSDISPMFEAYMENGIAGVKALYNEGAISDLSMQAWSLVNEGIENGGP